ncbi:MAG: EAL domain-containing protein, partial [Xanthobacteraceae bacterium]
MVRISAIFIAACMALIAACLGAILYLGFAFTGAESGLAALGTLSALTIYNVVSARLRDRAEASAQISTLSRSSGDLARQVAEFGPRLDAMDRKIEQAIERSLQTAQPLAAELEELSALVNELADSAAAHERALASAGRATPAGRIEAPASGIAGVGDKPAAEAAMNAVEAALSPPPIPPDPAAAVPPALERPIAAFNGLDRDGIIALIRSAIDAGNIDLYLQPIVTLPQRKVRFYEAVSRLKTDNGDVIAAADFLKYAEAGSLVPKLDHLTVLRCVQVVRRLLLKNREVGLFCNLSGATLADAEFPRLLEFVEANRAIAPSLLFEFSQSAVRAMGPMEHESLAALAERGFHFSMDNLADLRLEPRELSERGFRFVKAPGALLLARAGAASTDIHPADLSDLLNRFGIDLAADRIENESTVVDLLDYDVRFGQGFLFAPPRPVRAEALQAADGEGAKAESKQEAMAEAKPATKPAAKPDSAQRSRSGGA